MRNETASQLEMQSDGTEVNSSFSRAAREMQQESRNEPKKLNDNVTLVRSFVYSIALQ